MKRVITTVAVCLFMALCLFPVDSRAAEGKNKASVEISTQNVEYGDEITVTVHMSTKSKIASMMIAPVYDGDVLEYVSGSGEWLSGKHDLANFRADGTGVMAVSESRVLDGAICQFRFRVKNNAKLGQSTVSCSVQLRNGDEEIAVDEISEATYEVIGEDIDTDRSGETTEGDENAKKGIRGCWSNISGSALCVLASIAALCRRRHGGETR